MLEYVTFVILMDLGFVRVVNLDYHFHCAFVLYYQTKNCCTIYVNR